ncbi:trans-sialidase, putative, partial [Trypanosoma cruzi marinkellei]
MHSRIAAVKAPRTHNCRRVTGSSGRRREGRESEPQRPNMSRQVFHSAVLFLLFVVWVCCSTCGTVTADDSNSVAVQPEEPRSCPGSSSGKLFYWRDVNESGETVGS